MAGFKMRKPVDPHVLMVEVVGTKQVSPHLVRVTLGGAGLDLFTPLGFDQWMRLFLPRTGQETLRLPTRSSGLWYAQYLATPRAKRPHVRCYTVRAFRGDLRELDVDFVVHAEADGTSGPAATFATTAAPGDRIGLLDQGVGYHPRHAHDWTLLVADETGLPAVAGICESLPADARGLAIVEIPSDADRQRFRVPDGLRVEWVARDGATGTPGELALAALRAAELPDGTVYAYLVGESGLATGARRHLVAERAVPKAHVDFIGYWRHGHAAM
ncbi:siderophore-interacting protein [Asanoa sp. WMMD1127]|uniref:siderophore-interacting protein n=1 Tax=Asanoa sp. WMMD1127 TaxID=3016107 RepID=UPI002415F038|nr:siderophore-interacting protein [Asanoa sp. WMMD1127]MDG4825413.1 siderophore-interacting protein [Asanoa sp. WMMD1127]